MLSNSFCNHTHDQQIVLLLHGHPISSVTHMITDQIGLHSVLLPLCISKCNLESSVVVCLNFGRNCMNHFEVNEIKNCSLKKEQHPSKVDYTLISNYMRVEFYTLIDHMAQPQGSTNFHYN